MATKSNVDSNDFISVNVKASVLRKMLSGQNIHLTDIHCTCAQSKQQLQKLLLQALSKEEC
jgi:hypothetical protein